MSDWPGRGARVVSVAVVVAFIWGSLAHWTGMLGVLTGVATGLVLLWWALPARRLLRGGAPVPPTNVRAVMADGREIPLECRHIGWDATRRVHRWEAVYALPEMPREVRMDALPARCIVELLVQRP